MQHPNDPYILVQRHQRQLRASAAAWLGAPHTADPTKPPTRALKG